MNQQYSTDNTTSPFFRFRYNSSIALLAGLLLFLLPFARIKCGTVKIADNTGIGMAMGKQWNVSFMGMDNELFGDLNGMGDKKGGRLSRSRPQWFIAFAAIISLCGLGISLSNWEMRLVVTMSAAILAVVLLAIGYFDLKMQLQSMPFDDAYESGGLGGAGFIKLKFTIWYFLSVAFFATAAIFSYKHHRIQLQDKLDEMMQFEFQQQEEEGKMVE